MDLKNNIHYFKLLPFARNIMTAFILTASSFPAQTIWSAGPMVHFNFGNHQTRVSFGLEFAYWNFSHFPYSIDFCTEFESHKIRLYSELQTGVGLAGISAGPVLEIQTDKPALKLGFQTSVWGNYFLGADLRYRYIDKTSFFCTGPYFKIAFHGRDKNGNASSTSSTYRSSHHHHD